MDFSIAGIIPTPFPIASDAKAWSLTLLIGKTSPATGTANSIVGSLFSSIAVFPSKFSKSSVGSSSKPTIIVRTAPSTNETKIEIKSPINCVV